MKPHMILFQVNWCTGFSDGYHKMTFSLDQVQSSDTTNTDQCLQYKLEFIPRTNIHLLVLNDRQIGGCNDVALQVSYTDFILSNSVVHGTMFSDISSWSGMVQIVNVTISCLQLNAFPRHVFHCTYYCQHLACWVIFHAFVVVC